MKPRLAFFIANLICGFAWGQEITVIDVHRSIPLSDAEPIYRDYILNIGTQNLKNNLVITVYRKKQIRDSNGSQFFGELKIPVGQLKIISAQPPIAIAREFKIFDRESNPFLDIQAIMVGDNADLKGSFVAAKAKSPANALTGLVLPIGIPLESAPNKESAAPSAQNGDYKPATEMVPLKVQERPRTPATLPNEQPALATNEQNPSNQLGPMKSPAAPQAPETR